ncbi:MAG: Rne/Rng family ribonuclease [Nitrospinae bacterium]|nr:Rne/Rng family ribonuclease [Nitrospinota bacterium]
MPSQIICNVTSRETRVALVENRQITELFIERKADQGIVGNIYKGVVSKVLPGMQVAFVDIGLDKAGFLYVSDVDQNHGTHLSNYLSATGHAGEPGEEVQIEREEAHTNGHASIEELLTEGQEIMVQASKDPMGSKGARITTYISLPGRYLVYMPTINQIGVSRRIESEEEKLRLKETLTRIRVSGAGYIIRTAAEGKTAEELKADVEYLDKLWRSIRHRFDAAPAPSVVYRDLSIILRSIRDLFTGAVAEALIDDRAAHEEAVMFCRSYLPDVADRINLYTGPEPVFTKFGIELDIERALGRRVWLKSGGYIVIDQTEALTAIDVNTGKFVGTRDQEETIVKTNLEAVQEIVYQLRLRNIGGLIIIDFIDMERPENKEKVYAALEQALKNDRSRTNILKISELGLVEMTRKRSRDSLSRIQTTVCPYCEGRGRIKSATTTLYEVYREIRRAAAELDPGSRELTVTVAPEVAELMFEEESQYLAGLEKDLDIQIVAQADPKLHQERFTVAPSRENVIK